MDLRENYIKITNKFFFMYYTILLSLLANIIIYYYSNSNADISMVTGLVLISSLLIISLSMILLQQFCLIDEGKNRLMFAVLYLITGLVIVFTEPRIVLKISQVDGGTDYFHGYVMIAYIGVGARNLIKTRRLFYVISYLVVSLHLGLMMYIGKFHGDFAVTYAVLCMFIFFQGDLIIKVPPAYNIIITEGNDHDYIDEARTPLDEIIHDIKQVIEKNERVSSRSSPKLQKIYEKFQRTFERILKKLQTSNLYSSKLELITKNMDVENKLYIEQGFFDSGTSSINYMPENVQPKKIIEYNMSELLGFLRQIGKDWNFNTFFISECSHAPIKVIGEYIVKIYRLEEMIGIPEVVLSSFLETLEENYLDNPYHNSCHGADVLCSYIYLIENTSLKKFMNSLEWFGGIIASLAHDVGHLALNNRYLIMVQHEYAMVYNDISVLENMHASLLFKLLRKENCNIFQGLNMEKYLQIRKLIIDLILATDMGKHFDLVSYIRVKYSESVDLSNVDVRHDMFKLLIKAADVGHAAKTLELHQRWCGLVIEEFYAQGDLEKEKNLAVSMFCDRETTLISKAQVGFIKNIVLILYETLVPIANSEEIEKNCIKQLKTNLKYWEGSNSKIQSTTERDENLNNLPTLSNKSRRGSL